jgi:hypothetical protein
MAETKVIGHRWSAPSFAARAFMARSAMPYRWIAAGQAASFFSRYAKSVTLVVRGDSLERGMSHYLIEQLQALDNVSVRLGTVVDEAHGGEHLECLSLRPARAPWR